MKPGPGGARPGNFRHAESFPRLAPLLLLAAACSPNSAPPVAAPDPSQYTRLAIRPPADTKEAWSLDIYDNGAALLNVQNCRADGQAVFGSILPPGTFAFSADAARLMPELGEQVQWHSADAYFVQLVYGGAHVPTGVETVHRNASEN